jgi:hypothetical protein
MKTMTVDEGQWPIIIVRYAETVDESEFDALLACIDEKLERAAREGRKIGLIYDNRSNYRASPRVRSKQAAWMKKRAALMRGQLVGVAFVFTSALVRGVLTAVLWLTDMPMPHLVASTMAEAEDWVRKRYDDQGQKSRLDSTMETG